MITDTLATWLIANINISTTQIYPNQAPQDATFPCAVYYLDDIQRVKTFDGTNATREAQLQIDVYAKTLLAAQTSAQQFIAELEDYVGTMGSLYVFDVTIEDENNGFEKNTELYSHSMFLSITYK